MKKFVIGVTGIMCSGKSSFCSSLKDLGFEYISADELVHNLYKDDSKGAKALEHLKIEGLINKDNSINKELLRKTMFNNKELREKIEKAVHPIIVEEIQELIKQKTNTNVVVEIPLLFEAGLENLCDITVAVYRNKKDVLKDIQKKYNITEPEAKTFLSAQMDITEKILKADFTIINNSDLNSLKEKAKIFTRSVNTVWQK